MGNICHYHIKVNIEATGVPSYFIWNGKIYKIAFIEKSWKIDYKVLDKSGYKYYFRVKDISQNTFEIAYDSLLDEWFLERIDPKIFLLTPQPSL
ncbi:MAG: hypothetical protein CBR30_04460 [Dictyoglomus sp. NZ13-RE01]|nr:MAG: hypothetical protein CBR30_04460 [Dictyoglomus sp. NZ13-RE01]